MYIRMLLIMGVTLYTSRVVLQTLGEEDFGIYNIVGGVVTLFTFINAAMTTGTQRHLSYELGKPDSNVTKVFSACLSIHFCLSVIIFILAETVGLWFLNIKMNFPQDKMNVVNWLYQFSILSCLATIIKAPYNAAIISYERMSFYAYSGVVEAMLKLSIVFLLLLMPGDKLLVYGILVFIISAAMLLWYYYFCKLRLAGIHYKRIHDKSLYKSLLSFSGWSLFGSFANVCYQQGVNIVINLFFGVSLNAAVGIANQVNGAISTFVNNFQQALNPQLVQSEANKDRNRQKDLIYKSSKFSFFIMLMLSFPIIANLDYILSLWLGHYPAHTAEICKLIIMGVLVSCLSGPLWVSIYATGKIKYYQLAVSSVAITVIPIIYIGGQFGMNPEMMFFVRSLNYIAVLIIQLYYLKRYIGLDILAFIISVIVPTMFVTAGCFATYFVMRSLWLPAEHFLDLIYQSAVYCLFCISLILFIGLNVKERKFIFVAINRIIHKI